MPQVGMNIGGSFHRRPPIRIAEKRSQSLDD
jgi:hypothetical protein